MWLLILAFAFSVSGEYVLSGEQALQRSRYVEALRSFDRALLFADDSRWNARAWGGKGEALYHLGSTKASVPCFRRAVELSPPGYSKERWIFCLARSYLALGMYDTLEVLFKRYLPMISRENLPSFLALQSLTYLYTGDFESAERIVEALEELPPGERSRFGIRLVVVMLKIVERKWESAFGLLEDMIESALEEGRTDVLPTLFYALSYVELERGDYGAVLKVIERAEKSAGVPLKDPMFTALKVIVWDRQKQYHRGIVGIRSSLKAHKCEPMLEEFLYYGMEAFYYKKKMYKGAFAVLDTLFSKVDSLRWEGKERMLSAEMLYIKNKYKSALKDFERVAEIDSELAPFALFGKGWCLYRLGRYRESYDVFSSLYGEARLRYFKPAILYRMARCAFNLGEMPLADSLFKVLLKEYPKSSFCDDALLLREKIALFSGEVDSAAVILERLVKEYPDSRWAPRAVKLLGDAFFKREDYKRAKKYYSMIAQLDAPFSLLDEVNFLIVRCDYHLGKFRDPIAMNRAFIELHPNSPRSAQLQLEIADYYRLKGRFKRALKEYDKVIDFPGGERYAGKLALRKAECYSELGEDSLALECYYSALKDTFTADEALRLLSGFLEDKGEYGRLIALWEERVNSGIEGRELASALYKIGKWYTNMEAWGEASTVLARLINSFVQDTTLPFVDSALVMMVEVKRRAGDIEGYGMWLDTLIAKAKSNETRAQGFFWKAELLCEEGNLESAKSYFEQSATSYGVNREKVAMVFMEAARFGEEMGDLQWALKNYERARAFYPKDKVPASLNEKIEHLKSLMEGEGGEE